MHYAKHNVTRALSLKVIKEIIKTLLHNFIRRSALLTLTHLMIIITMWMYSSLVQHLPHSKRNLLEAEINSDVYQSTRLYFSLLSPQSAKTQTTLTTVPSTDTHVVASSLYNCIHASIKHSTTPTWIKIAN